MWHDLRSGIPKVRIPKHVQRLASTPEDQKDFVRTEQILFRRIKSIRQMLREKDRLHYFKATQIITAYSSVEYDVMRFPKLADIAHKRLFEIEVRVRRLTEEFYQKMADDPEIHRNLARSKFLNFALIERNSQLNAIMPEPLDAIYFRDQVTSYMRYSQDKIKVFFD